MSVSGGTPSWGAWMADEQPSPAPVISQRTGIPAYTTVSTGAQPAPSVETVAIWTPPAIVTLAVMAVGRGSLGDTAIPSVDTAPATLTTANARTATPAILTNVSRQRPLASAGVPPRRRSAGLVPRAKVARTRP